MNIKIALAGNPNSGKTTLFNALTGQNQYVGNWPGVTVEKKEGKIKYDKSVTLVDLPGIYSLSAYTPEEVVARSFLINEKPDVILNIVDGTNLERNLYLTTQLMELGIPVVVAVNMMDSVKKRGDKIDIEKLSVLLGCPVVEMSAYKSEGVKKAALCAIEEAKRQDVFVRSIFSDEIKDVLARIEKAISGDVPKALLHWYAVKAFERDDIAKNVVAEDVESIVSAAERMMDDDAESIIINERYTYISQILSGAYVKNNKNTLTVSDKIDKVVTNRILALPLFVLIMWLVYTISIGTVGDLTVVFMNDILFGEWIAPAVCGFLESIGCAPWLVSLVTEGIVGGVGSVLGFVPQMMILFLMLSVLEDIGYMSRVAFIMDRIFRRFGLSGKSFIPMLVGSGCGVPGVMASRTIESDRDRKMTIMTTCFVPCGAKMPIVGLVASALFGGSAFVAAAAYFIGIGAVVVSGIILKKTKLFCGDVSPFVMELPSYHMPVASNILRTAAERGISFIKRAGSVILLASVVIWALNSFTLESGFHYIGDGSEKSVLNILGEGVAVVFAPLGFGSWQAAVATILGLVAKEEVVGVFGSLSSMADADLAFELVEEGSARLAVIGQEFFGSSRLSAFSFLIFNLLCAPCFAAMGAIRREMNSAKWTAYAISYMCFFAYAVSFMVYQFGTFIMGDYNPIGIFLAVVCLGVFIFLLLRPERKNNYG